MLPDEPVLCYRTNRYYATGRIGIRLPDESVLGYRMVVDAQSVEYQP